MDSRLKRSPSNGVELENISLWLKNILPISQKARKAIIVNGRLLMNNRRIVYARREGYDIVFFTVSQGAAEKKFEAGAELILEYLDNFDNRFGYLINRETRGERNTIQFIEDRSTGALIIRSEIYECLTGVGIGRMDGNRIHAIVDRYDANTSAKLKEIVAYCMSGYYDIYVCLLNKPLTSSYTRMRIKSHFVAGLYQPIIVETSEIVSPLTYGWFNRFHDLLGLKEVNPMEGYNFVSTTAKNDERTFYVRCVSSYELGLRLVDNPEDPGQPGVVPRLLERPAFMYMLLTVLEVIFINRTGETGLMVKEHQADFRKIEESYPDFLTNFMTGTLNALRQRGA